MDESRSARSKAAILSAIRHSQQRARLPDLNREKDDRLEPTVHAETDCLQRLQNELDILGVEYYLEKTQKAVKERIHKLIKDKSILSWDGEQLPYDAGTLLQHREVYFGCDDIMQQASADIGLTGCDAAIAETGSLILCSGEGKPRTASLLPLEHVALVRRKDIFFTMGEFFSKNRREVRRTSCLNIVTGPSRTADIELSLTLGVHGPGKVIVVVGP